MTEEKNILITGANGFLGSCITRELHERNRLFVVGRKKPEGIKCEFYYADLSKGLDTSKFPKKIDWIIHLAAELDMEKINRVDAFNLHVLSTLHLLEYAKSAKAGKFIYTSTGGVYGEYSDQPFSETMPMNFDVNFYSYTKAIADTLVQRYSNLFTTIILRPFYIYGGKQDETRWIMRIINSVINGSPITLFNKGKNPRLSVMYIDDFLEAFLKAMKLNRSEIINISGNETRSIKEIAETAGKIIGKKVKFVYKEDKNVKNRIADISKMKKLLNFEPKTKFEDGMRKLLSLI
ncbi:MAG: NAD(P)-dependent oxidoreductase [Nanoarchaeota archaeon]